MPSNASLPDRRAFIRTASALALSSISARAFGDAPPPSSGCCLSDSEFDPLIGDRTSIESYQDGDEPILNHSDNPIFDRALVLMLASVSKVFNVLPGFGFYDDSNGHNARANPRNRMNRSDGTVLLGLGLLAEKLQAEPGGVQVAAVCAHEFAHIVQFTHYISGRLKNGQPTVKPVELNADFLAGYFAAVYQESNPTFHAEQFAMSQYNGGDTQTWDSQHHGTREERGAAVAAGFKAYKQSKLNFSDAIEFSVQYALGV